MWDEVLGHQQNKKFLQKLLKPGSRPHALLFYGMGGIGKKMLALHFAKTFLCKSAAKKPCGICESCRLMEGKDIKIEQVKEMAKQAAFAPVLSEHKVCIIDDAGQMTAEAANSLLKLLEEPPPGWLFILITQQAERLLPTVLSRVVRLRFDAPDSSAVRQILKAKGITQNTQVLAALAGGSPGRALSYNQADVFAIRFTEKTAAAKPFWLYCGAGLGRKIRPRGCAAFNGTVYLPSARCAAFAERCRRAGLQYGYYGRA